MLLALLRLMAFYSDIFANRPAFGYAGRVFISTDTGAIYEDTGTSWTLIADAGAGTTGTLQQVTTNGSSTTVGLSTSGNGIGIGTTIPASNKLDIHSASGINATFNGTTTTNAALQLQNAGTGKWNIQNLYNAGANSFQVYDVLNSTARLTILNTGVTTFSGNINADGGLEMSGQVLGFNQSGTRSWQVQATGGNLRFQSGDNLGTFSFLSPLSGTAFIPSGATIPTNGMYLSAANTLNFATNSTNRLTIASTGASTFNSSVTAGVTNGSALIATAQEYTNIDINVTAGGVAQRNFTISNAYNNYGVLEILAGTTQNGAATFSILKLASTGAATFISSATATAFIPSGATVPTNGMYLSAANTLNFATNTTNRLTINSSGNVGIESASPTEKLTVGDLTASVNVHNKILIAGQAANVNNTAYASLVFAQTNQLSLPNATVIEAGRGTGSNEYTYLAFKTSNDATGGQEKMRIDNLGSVGISTTTIGSKLQVNGNAAIGYSASTAGPTNGLAVAGGVTIGTATNNVSSIVTTGYSLTGANAQSLLDLAGTWNTTGNPTAIKLNITNTASGSTSNLMDLQVGAVSKMSVDKSGNLIANNVLSGTYTPTVTASTNCAAVTAFTCQYLRVGSVVTVSGKVYGSATATNTETIFTMTVPINSNFATVEQCGGTGRSAEGGVAPSGAGYVAFVNAISANTVRFSYTAPAVLGTGGNFWFSFTYLIV